MNFFSFTHTYSSNINKYYENLDHDKISVDIVKSRESISELNELISNKREQEIINLINELKKNNFYNNYQTYTDGKIFSKYAGNATVNNYEIKQIKLKLKKSNLNQKEKIIDNFNKTFKIKRRVEEKELVELVKKFENCVKFENINPKKSRDLSTRIVFCASDKDQKKIFIKTRPAPVSTGIPRNEQLAYRISRDLNLNVVPPTIGLEGCSLKNILPKELRKNLKRLAGGYRKNYEGMVIQEEVHLYPNQKAEPEFLKELNQDQIANAIFFNLITARRDASEKNSVVDQHKTIVEFDNEFIGDFKGGNDVISWLFQEFTNAIFSKKVIENLLDQKNSTIENIFEEMKQFNFFDENEKLNMIERLEKIQQFFISKQNKNNITVNNLLDYLLSEKIIVETSRGDKLMWISNLESKPQKNNVEQHFLNQLYSQLNDVSKKD
jgi:hypothetical protein